MASCSCGTGYSLLAEDPEWSIKYSVTLLLYIDEWEAYIVYFYFLLPPRNRNRLDLCCL